MNEHELFIPINVRFFVFAAFLSLATVGIALASGWEIALSFIGFCTIIILSFTNTSILIVATVLVFTLNQTYFLLGLRLLDNVRWILLALCAFQAGIKILTRKIARKWIISDLIMVSGLFYAFFSTTYSGNPNITFQRSISLLLLYFTVFWLLWNYAERNGEERLIGLLTIAGFFVFYSSILMVPSSEGWDVGRRFRGITPNPNTLGLLASVYVPLLVWSWLKTKSLFAAFGVIAAITCTLLSGSRTAFLSVTSSLLYLSIVIRSRRIIVSAALLILMTIAYILVEDVPTAFSEIPVLDRIFNNTYIDYSSGRFEVWSGVLSQIENNWLYGNGFGIDAVGYYSLGGTTFELAGVHNTYLQILFQLGVIGSFLYLVPLIILAIITFKYALLESKLNLIHILHAVLISGLVTAIFENWIYSAGNAFTFPFWTCVMLILYRQHQQTFKSDRVNHKSLI